jgi:hypothetical protein
LIKGHDDPRGIFGVLVYTFSLLALIAAGHAYTHPRIRHFVMASFFDM